MKKLCIIAFCSVFLCHQLTAAAPDVFAPPPTRGPLAPDVFGPPPTQGSFNDMFKDIDFEQLAKEMDTLFKEIEAEEKAKQSKTQALAPEATVKSDVSTPSTPLTQPAPHKKSNKKPTELFITPETQPAPTQGKKQLLWLTQETLDATDTVLDDFSQAVTTLTNTILEARLISIEELSPHLNTTDIIKVACGIIKSKTSYKRLLLIPQIIKKELEKPMELLRKDIVRATKKIHELTKNIKILAPEEQQDKDIDMLQKFATKQPASKAPETTKPSKQHAKVPKEKTKAAEIKNFAEKFADVIGKSDTTEIND